MVTTDATQRTLREAARGLRGTLRGMARGMGEATLVIALFVGLGLGGAEWLRTAGPAPRYPGAVPVGSPRPLVLVDGFNVLHAAVLQGRDRAEWWTSPRRTEVLDLAAAYGDPDAGEAEVVVVFDGEKPAEEEEAPGDVRQVFAPSADAWLLERVKQCDPGDRVVVVTADRALAGRAQNRGARILSPHEFVRRCRKQPA